MREIQQILLQLREARRYRLAPNPNAGRLSLLLLDNLAELVLRWRAESELAGDQTSWFGVRAFSRSRRRAVDRYHAKLVEFAHQRGWLTEGDVTVLNYCHSIRNGAYHAGEADPVDCGLASLLLSEFLRRYLPEHRSGRGFVALSSDEITLDRIESDDTGRAGVAFLGSDFCTRRDVMSEQYWRDVVDMLLPPEEPGVAGALLSQKVDVFFDRFSKNMRAARRDHDLELWGAVRSRFFQTAPSASFWAEERTLSLSGALRFYLALLPLENELLDISDPAARTRRMAAALREYRPQERRFPMAKEREEVRRRLKQEIAQGVEGGVRAFLTEHERLSPYYQAVEELSFDLNFFAQDLMDAARSK